MTWAEFEEAAVEDFASRLEKAGFVDGDRMSPREIAETDKVAFYQGFDVHPESRTKDAVVFDVVPVTDGKSADDMPLAYCVTIGVDINTSLGFRSRGMLALCSAFEKAFDGTGWRLSRTGNVKEENGRNIVSYDARKAFAYAEG